MTRSEQKLKEFNKKLDSLLKKYNVGLSVQLIPVGWLSNLLKKYIKVRYSIVIIDKDGN